MSKTSLRPNEPSLPEALAYFLTWGTYGTWLPGDKRGWVQYRRGWQPPAPYRESLAKSIMTEAPCILDWQQRKLVEATIAKHCRIRGWKLYEANCRKMHVHVVVPTNEDPDVVRDQLKAWCTRALKELERERRGPNAVIRKKWWAERGSKRYINDHESLEAVIAYVRDGQDRPREEYRR